jgi:hypothetical protein
MCEGGGEISVSRKRLANGPGCKGARLRCCDNMSVEDLYKHEGMMNGVDSVILVICGRTTWLHCFGLWMADRFIRTPGNLGTSLGKIRGILIPPNCLCEAEDAAHGVE